MNNVIHFPTKLTTAPQRAAFADAVLARVHETVYAPMPARITANPTINRAVTDLQQKGWKVASLSPEITLSQPSTNEEMGLVDALRRQRQIEWVRG